MSRAAAVVLVMSLSACSNPFFFEARVGPVDDQMAVLADGELQGLDEGIHGNAEHRITVARTFSDYEVGVSDGRLKLSILIGDAVIFDRELVPGACSTFGDAWERETLFVFVEPAPPRATEVSGYECQRGSTVITAVP